MAQTVRPIYSLNNWISITKFANIQIQQGVLLHFLFILIGVLSTAVGQKLFEMLNECNFLKLFSFCILHILKNIHFLDGNWSYKVWKICLLYQPFFYVGPTTPSSFCVMVFSHITPLKIYIVSCFTILIQCKWFIMRKYMCMYAHTAHWLHFHSLIVVWPVR